MAKNANPVVTSPKGILKYPHLNTPDTKFNSKGVYSTKLLLDPEEGEKFARGLDIFYEQALKAGKAESPKMKAADKPYHFDEEAGKWEFNFKMNASYTSKKTGEEIPLKPSLFDAKNKPLKEGTKITGGSIARVACEVVPFAMKGPVGAGISLRLKAVQVIDLKVWDTDPSAFGFEVEEGGYEDPDGEDAWDTNGFSDESSDDDDSNDGDF